MDNSVEGKNNQSESISYSSQDILNKSLAGKKDSLFTRVKKSRLFLKRKEKPVNNFTSIPKSTRSRFKSVNKKQLLRVAIIVFSILLLIGGTTIVILLVNNNRDDSAKTVEGEEIDEPAYTEEEEAYTENVPEEISTLKPDQTDKDINIVDYVTAQVNYIDALVNSDLLKTAADEMESVMSEIEMNPDAFTDCQLASAYRASLRIQEADIAKRRAAGQDVADPAEEEDENSDTDENGEQYYTAGIIERMKKAAEVCGE